MPRTADHLVPRLCRRPAGAAAARRSADAPVRPDKERSVLPQAIVVGLALAVLLVCAGHPLAHGLSAGRIVSFLSPQYRAALSLTVVVCLMFLLWLQQKRHSLASRRALTITLDTISQGVLMLDRRGRVAVANRRALDLLGVDERNPRRAWREAAKRARRLTGGQNAEVLPQQDDRGWFGSGVVFETIRDDGTVIEVHSYALSDGGVVHAYADVTEQRLADARIRYLAHHDALTGLANRAQLRRRLPDFLSSDPADPRCTAFLLIGLDGFKAINETLGHDAGDEILIEAARRLMGLVRDADFVARSGGDEFVVLLPGLLRPDDAVLVAERIIQRLSEPVSVDRQQLQVGACIGLAFHPRDALIPDILLKHADIALYAAKAQGRGSTCCFDAAMTEAVNERRALETGLGQALENGELAVHFQPIFAAGSLAILGFEALARWRHPVRGQVAPETFIHVAEDCGLINRLGLWVIEQACAAATRWRARCRVAVNVSAMQLRDGHLPQEVAAILARTGLPPELLEIEVTETVLADSNQTVMQTLTALKAMGVRIALDDFGTGYSSLSYLRRFSFDKIKIDKSFVQGQATDQGVRVILESILGMCRNLGLPVVGEGVETLQQLALLRQHGCTEVQGYLMARPMPMEAVEQYLRGQRRLDAAGAGHKSFDPAP